MKYFLMRLFRFIYMILSIFAIILLYIRYIFIQEINNLLFDDEVRNLILIFTTLVGFTFVFFDTKKLLTKYKKEEDKTKKIKILIPYVLQKILSIIIIIIISSKTIVGFLNCFYVFIILCGLGSILSEMIALLLTIIAIGYHLQVAVVDKAFIIYGFVIVLITYFSTGYSYIKKAIVVAASLLGGIIFFLFFKFIPDVVYFNLLACFIGCFFVFTFLGNLYYDYNAFKLKKSFTNNFEELADNYRY